MRPLLTVMRPESAQVFIHVQLAGSTSLCLIEAEDVQEMYCHVHI